MEIDQKIPSWERCLGIGVKRLKKKIVTLRNQKNQDLAMKLLTNDLNNMNLTTKHNNLTTNSDVKVGSLLDLVTQHTPNNESVWLESCSMASPVEAKQVIARGLKVMPNSVNLWMKAAELESENVEKMRVLMKGIESIPNSVRLWKEVVGFANENDARFLLQRAVECCPLCVEFWLALACLMESFDDAKMVIDKGREKLPRDIMLTRASNLLALTKDVTSVIGLITNLGLTSLRSTEISDTEGGRLANEALVEQDAGSVAKWEVMKVLMYNVNWERSSLPRSWYLRRRIICKTSLPNSQ